MNANSYAISPANFHDWQYEKFSAFTDARDEALESYKQDCTAELISDTRCGIWNRADSMFCDVSDAIGCDGAKSEKFNRLMYGIWAGSDIAVIELRKMLETEMDKLMERAFDTAADRR